MILRQAYLRDYRDKEIPSRFLNVVFLDASWDNLVLEISNRKKGEPDATMLLLLVELDAFLPIWCRNHTAPNFLKTVVILHNRQWIDWRAIQWPWLSVNRFWTKCSWAIGGERGGKVNTVNVCHSHHSRNKALHTLWAADKIQDIQKYLKISYLLIKAI